jgi:hypothetical protein
MEAAAAAARSRRTKACRSSEEPPPSGVGKGEGQGFPLRESKLVEGVSEMVTVVGSVSSQGRPRHAALLQAGHLPPDALGVPVLAHVQRVLHVQLPQVWWVPLSSEIMADSRPARSPLSLERHPSCHPAAGVWRGTVLTAWRLLRCNPWGEPGAGLILERRVHVLQPPLRNVLLLGFSQ